jgi:metal-responsive CopG/Arc/MetJ family transcriptional regulator
MDKKSTQRELVNRKRFNTSADINLLNSLDELSKETMIPKSKLIDRALELLLKEYEKK